MDGAGATDVTWSTLALLLGKDCRARVEAGRPGRRLQSLDRRSWSGRPWVRVETQESTVCVEDEGHGRKGGAGLLS